MKQGRHTNRGDPYNEHITNYKPRPNTTGGRRNQLLNDEQSSNAHVRCMTPYFYKFQNHLNKLLLHI